MAYPISNEILELFKNRYRQTVEISFYGTEETLYLTESDIVQGGMSVDRYCVSGSNIEIGSAIASELTLVLNNKNGKFNDVIFEGAELFVRVGIKKWDARKWEKAVMHYIPMGYFTVDNSPRKLTSISLSALDRMVQFDKEVKKSDLKFPASIGDLLLNICNKCNISLATNPSALTNYGYTVKSFPEEDNITYRQILMWIAEITGTCAYIDWDGKLRLEWYNSECAATISTAERYSSDLYEKAITIRGVKAADSDGNEYIADISEPDTYALNIESNGLLQSNAQSVVNNLAEKIGGFRYTPYTCTAKPFVHLYPLDSIIYVDRNGAKIPTIVTNVTYYLNGNMTIAAQGESVTSSGYASSNPLTKQQATIIANIIKQADEEITARENAIIKLNEMIVNSLGLYQTAEEQSNGSIKYYFHNEVSLCDSNVIYTFNEGGFAWTNKWNGDETVWQYGFTRDGNAVLNMLSAYQIQSEQIASGSITAAHLSVEYTEELAGDLDKRNAELTQNFEAADGLLKSDITLEYKNAISEAKETLQTQITQTEDKITLAAAKIEDLDGSISDCQSQIDINSDNISMVVNRTYGATIEGYGYPTDDIDKGSLYYDTVNEIYYYYNAILESWEETNGSSIQSAFVQTADGFELSGLVSVSGDLITSGEIRGLTVGTAPTPFGNGIVLNSENQTLEFQDGGVVIGQWNFVDYPHYGTVIKPMNYGFLGINDVTAGGTWDFSLCDEVTGLSRMVAVFG